MCIFIIAHSWLWLPLQGEKSRKTRIKTNNMYESNTGEHCCVVWYYKAKLDRFFKRLLLLFEQNSFTHIIEYEQRFKYQQVRIFVVICSIALRLDLLRRIHINE